MHDVVRSVTLNEITYGINDSFKLQENTPKSGSQV